MAITPEELFTTLEAGDLLMIPFERLTAPGQTMTLFATVLRIGQDGELYLSLPHPDRPTAQAYRVCNPFRWDPKLGILVDKDGDMPKWYSVNITRERGGAMNLAKAYAKVPRLDALPATYAFSDADIKRFVGNDPNCALLDGIINNGEAGGPGSQLGLALGVMGVQINPAQFVGLAHFMDVFAAKNRTGAVILALAERNVADGQDLGGLSATKPH